MYHAPIIVMTSNNERDFSDAFKRRCVQIEFKPTRANQIALIKKYFPSDTPLLEAFERFESWKSPSLKRFKGGQVPPNDAVIQALYATKNKEKSGEINQASFEEQLRIILKER